MSSDINLGLLYAAGETPSEARANAKSVFTGLGTDISALPASKQVPIVISHDDSGGFNLDEAYFQSADRLSYINFRRKHLHSQDTDISGGTLRAIHSANPRNILLNWKTPSVTQFQVNKHASAAAPSNVAPGVSTTHYVIIESGTTSGQYSNLYTGGIRLGFGKDVLCMMKMQVSHDSSLAIRGGIGMEYANSSTDNEAKLGMEGCDADGTNYRLVTADGTSRTKTITSIPIIHSPAGMRGYRLQMNVAAAEATLENSDGTSVTTDDTLPGTGPITSNKLFRLGINTATTAKREIYLASLFISAEDQDTLWFDD